MRPALSLSGRCAISLVPMALGLGWLGLSAGHLIAAALVAALALDAGWSRWNLRALELRELAPSKARVGATLGLELALRGRRNRDLSLRCAGPTLSSDDCLRRVITRQTAHVELPARPLFRGRFERVELLARSAYPLGLVLWVARFSVPAQLLVLPAKTRVPTQVTRALSAGGGRRPRSSADPTLHGELAPWRPGQSLRRVHWKLSARLGQPIISEPPRVRETTLVVVLSRCLPEATSPRREQALEQAFERAVSLAAALVERALQRSLEVRLVLVDGSGARTSDSLRGRRGAGTALELLAETVAQPAGHGEPIEAVESVETVAGLEPGLDSRAALPLGKLPRVVWIAVEGSPAPADLQHLGDLRPELSLIAGPRQLETLSSGPERRPGRRPRRRSGRHRERGRPRAEARS